MQLTERQCWKIIRQLVTDKNNEYKQFLKDVFDFSREPNNFGRFDAEQIKQIQGFTRDAFLYKCGFNSMTAFYDAVRDNGKEPNSRWHENLSCEDLLLFLDFRCRSLQAIYSYYKQQGTINKSNIRQIVEETKVSPLKHYRRGGLRCEGKAERVEGEQKLSSLNITEQEMKEMAILQTLTSMAQKYADRYQVNTLDVQSLADNIVTHNIDLKGNITGHKLKATITLNPTKSQQVRIPTYKPDPTIKAAKLAGFDVNCRPIFMKDGVQVDLIGQKVPERKIVYDPAKQLIQDSEEHSI